MHHLIVQMSLVQHQAYNSHFIFSVHFFVGKNATYYFDLMLRVRLIARRIMYSEFILRSHILRS